MTATPRPELVVEAIDPALIGVYLDPPTVPATLVWCLDELAAICPDPARLDLVITGDIEASTRHRLPDGTAATHRAPAGGGITAGRTLRAPDGGATVLLHAVCFELGQPAPKAEASERLARRALVHEAQHVAMHQNGQRPTQHTTSSTRQQNLSEIAAAIVEEYRAEVSITGTLREGEAAWSIADIAESLDSNLAAAVATYQLHRDLTRVVHEVTISLMTAWRVLAYIAAAPSSPSDTTPAITPGGLDTWKRAIAPHWPGFCDAVAHAPIGTAVLAQHALDAIVHGVTDVLDASLIDLGFLWTDDHFAIEGWFFEQDSYLEAYTRARQHAGSLTERLRARWSRRRFTGGSIY